METNKDIQRGMQLTASLPDIMPEQADEQIQTIYEDTKQTLRVPLVNLIFRTMANYPGYFEPMWRGLSPTFRSMAFEEEADLLRRKAVLDQSPDTTGFNRANVNELEKLKAFNDTIHYVLPKLLLVTTAFDELSFGRLSATEKKHGSRSPDFPLGAARGTTKLEMVNPEKASEQVREIFESIKKKHGHPLVSSYYRGIANWPDFLEIAWNRIEPIVNTDEYEKRKQELVEQALTTIHKLPFNAFGMPEWNEDQRQEIKLILSAFRYKFIPEMLLDVTLIKTLLDGEKPIANSLFSASAGGT